MGKTLNTLLSESEGKTTFVSLLITPFGGYLDCKIFSTVEGKHFVGNLKSSNVETLTVNVWGANVEEVKGDNSGNSQNDSGDVPSSSYSL